MKNFKLPVDHRPYIDKYFLRAKEVLQKDNLNPIVKAQVFIRKGNCKVYGINEAIEIIKKYNPEPTNIIIRALAEGDYFKNGECLMTIEAPIQNIIDLETMYLGVLSAETTLKNGGKDLDLHKIKDNMKEIVNLVKPRPVSYFGARHWHYLMDCAIATACLEGGATNCSTDIGAMAYPEPWDKGIGTIPHALETIYHWKYGLDKAVEASTVAFCQYIKSGVPRIALIDYTNREVLDTLKVAPVVNGVRIDTCGENYMQGVCGLGVDDEMGDLRKEEHFLQGKGVSIRGVYIIRKLLNDSGNSKVKIILSSGFGNPNKVKTFIEAERLLGMKLFDSLGVGGVYESRMATMDIIEVDGKTIHKVGRLPKDYKRLNRII